MKSQPVNPYRDRAQARKAARLIIVLSRVAPAPWGLTTATIDRMTERDWENASSVANVTVPSAATRRLIRATVEDMSRAQSTSAH